MRGRLPVTLAMFGRILNEGMSDGDRACFASILHRPDAVQLTVAGTAHCDLYEMLATRGWAEPGLMPEVTDTAPEVRVWKLTAAGRAEIPALLVAVGIGRAHLRVEKAWRREIATFVLIHLGLVAAVYFAVFGTGFAQLVSGRPLAVMTAIAPVALVFVMLGTWPIAARAWAGRNAGGALPVILARLEMLRTRYKVVSFGMGIAAVLVSVAREGVIRATGGEALAPMTLARQSAGLVIVAMLMGWLFRDVIRDEIRRVLRQRVASQAAATDGRG